MHLALALAVSLSAAQYENQVWTLTADNRLAFDSTAFSKQAEAMPVAIPQGWEVHFSPHGGCTASIVAAIDSAAAHRDTILVLAYNFTSDPVGDALCNARKSGSVVRIIADSKASHQKGFQGQKCKAAGCEVYIDAKHAIAHSKVMVFGRKRVETGSFNYSSNAENNNAENAIFINDSELANQYIDNWNAHKNHSEPL